MINKKTLILIDIQNDFCEQGSLAVPDANSIIPIANDIQPYFDHIIATKDWHPLDHTNFVDNHPGHRIGEVLIVNDIPQILWIKHCVQYSFGAEFHSLLCTQRINKVIYKGVDKKIDSYSAFYDNAHEKSTGLYEYLLEQHIQEIYLMGLATDYCVKYSALDAIRLGLQVYVIQDGCRGIELNPGDIQMAWNDMLSAGVKLISSSSLKKKITIHEPE